MKLLLVPLLLLGAGAGLYARGAKAEAPVAGPSAVECPAECPVPDGRVTVERTSSGTCLVTCFDAEGEIVCQKETTCEASCDRPCENERPCTQRAACARAH